MSSTPPPPPPSNAPQQPGAPNWQPRQSSKSNKKALWIVLGAVGCVGLIVFGGCFSAIFIPNFLDALQKAKQKRTVADIRNIGSAYGAYETDNYQPGDPYFGELPEVLRIDQGTRAITHEELSQWLVPEYLNELPANDGWDNPYEFRVAESPGSGPGLIVRSAGRDTTFEDSIYARGSFDPTEYGNDIVWAAGYFYHWPQGAVQ